MSIGKFENLTGQVFGRLTVIERCGKNKWGNSLWLCECSCDNKRIIVSQNSLHNRNTQSCGCLMKEIVSKTQKKYNEFNLSGKYGIGITTNGRIVFYFDLEDYDLIKNYCWCNSKDNHITAKVNGKTIGLHRLIMGVEYISDVTIDHKDHNHPEDNRKENLRFCTNSQNNYNRGTPSNNTSGTIGIYWRKNRNKYASRITVDNKTINLGCFTNIEDAIIARLTAESLYFGEFAPQRHLFEQYGIQ
jgi:hypothetical protein